VALHNIPEGMSVSVPIYYATGSRRKAFIYSALSGLAEPVGAIANDEPSAFADAVERVLAADESHRRAAARARAEQFPWSTTIERMLRLHTKSPERKAA